MSTPHCTDSRLSSLFNNTEILIDNLIQILSENYKEGQLSLGCNNAKKFKNKEAYYTIVDSELENVFLTFVRKNDIENGLYEIILKTFNTDYPTELKIQVDSDIAERLPELMIKDLSNKIYDFKLEED